MADAGTLILIGGHEDKTGDRMILKAIADRLRGGRLVIATVASHEPEGYFESYQDAFGALGVSDLIELYVEEREQSLSRSLLDRLEGAAGVFFTGGDQLRITSQIGDTPLERSLRSRFEAGLLIAGTSAGASVMSETMLVKGSGSESHRIGDLHMSPGLGLLSDVIVDQHFAERGRFGRLLGAVAHNPRLIGLGIDEDTAVIVEGRTGRVVGAGAVYVVDAEEATHSNIAEARADAALSIFDVRLHVLAHGDEFDMIGRRPRAPGP